MHLELLLFTSLHSVCPRVREHEGHVLAEGSVFANEWFRDALTSALAANGKTFEEDNIHLLYLQPSREQVFENVQKRLQSTTGRENERRKLNTLEDVETRLKSYEKAITGKKWKRFDNSEAVHREIGSIFSGETTGS